MNLEQIAARFETYLFWELAEFGVFAKVDCAASGSILCEYRIDVTLSSVENPNDDLRFPVRVDAFALWAPGIDPFNTVKNLAHFIASDKAKWFLA